MIKDIGQIIDKKTSNINAFMPFQPSINNSLSKTWLNKLSFKNNTINM